MTPAPGRGAGVRSKLLPGVLDAGFASLATFAAGLAAVAVFDEADLGVYAVFFVAFTLGQLVAYQLIYVPAEIVAVGRVGEQRLTIFDDSLRIGILPSLAGASVVFAATLTTAPIASTGLIIGLTVTAWIATLLSPTQDHVRRTLHVADRSWHAAVMSTTQFLVSGAAIAVLLVLDAPAAWVPFGALALANLVSLSIGLLLVHHDRHHARASSHVTFRDLVAQGRWLLLQASIPAAAAFVTANIITYLAGPEAMGYAEAARIVAQPILVLAAGLIYPLRPRAMEAALSQGPPGIGAPREALRLHDRCGECPLPRDRGSGLSVESDAASGSGGIRDQRAGGGKHRSQCDPGQHLPGGERDDGGRSGPFARLPERLGGAGADRRGHVGRVRRSVCPTVVRSDRRAGGHRRPLVYHRQIYRGAPAEPTPRPETAPSS